MTQKTRVVIVQLRRPRSTTEDPGEMRSDPFWEYGSFGITGCHTANLMHARNASKLTGVRFAFAQGGRKGVRLVYLTPPVAIQEHGQRIEAVWPPGEMPFRYSEAPILICNTRPSNFPRFEAAMAAGNRQTPEGQFASNFRSRAHCLEEALADELVEVYTAMRRNAPDSAIARTYVDALPWPPPKVDGQREHTYERLLAVARDAEPAQQRLSHTKRHC